MKEKLIYIYEETITTIGGILYLIFIVFIGTIMLMGAALIKLYDLSQN